MAKQKQRLGDNIDWLSLGPVGLIIGDVFEMPVREIRRDKRQTFDHLPIPNVVVDNKVNPTLAELRNAIRTAYDVQKQKVDPDAFNKAIKTALESLIVILEPGLKDTYGLKPEKTGLPKLHYMIMDAASTLVAIEAGLTLKEEVPTKGPHRG